MYGLILFYLFLIGAAFGSFAGAMAWRLHEGRDVVRERSECEHCHHTLAWHDLIPLVSWLSLRGRCRYCHKPIGVSAIMMELGLGAAFALSFVVWPYGWSVLGMALFAVWLASLVYLTILFVYDVRHSLLPDVLVWPLTALGVIGFALLMQLQAVPYAQWPLEAFLALLPVTGVYWLLYTISGGRWIGFGDVKLGIFIGLILGWQGGVLALLVANYLGFFWILPALLRRKLDRSARMPFGPFLIVATFIVFLWGKSLLAWGRDFLLV